MNNFHRIFLVWIHISLVCVFLYLLVELAFFRFKTKVKSINMFYKEYTLWFLDTFSHSHDNASYLLNFLRKKTFLYVDEWLESLKKTSTNSTILIWYIRKLTVNKVIRKLHKKNFSHNKNIKSGMCVQWNSYTMILIETINKANTKNYKKKRTSVWKWIQKKIYVVSSIMAPL